MRMDRQTQTLTDILYLSFNNVLQKAVPTPDVTNPVNLPSVLLYMGHSSPPWLNVLHCFISHTIGPTDLAFCSTIFGLLQHHIWPSAASHLAFCSTTFGLLQHHIWPSAAPHFKFCRYFWYLRCEKFKPTFIMNHGVCNWTYGSRAANNSSLVRRLRCQCASTWRRF